MWSIAYFFSICYSDDVKNTPLNVITLKLWKAEALIDGS